MCVIAHANGGTVCVLAYAMVGLGHAGPRGLANASEEGWWGIRGCPGYKGVEWRAPGQTPGSRGLACVLRGMCLSLVVGMCVL